MSSKLNTLLLCLSTIVATTAMENPGKVLKVKPTSLFVPHKTGKIELFHTDDEGFKVIQNDEEFQVKQHDVDPLLQKIKHKQLKKFQKVGYITVQKDEDNNFFLNSNVRGIGGGPATGAFLYWLTKSACYGTALAAATTVVVASGGLGGAAVGGGLAIAGSGASVGTTIVAGALVGGGVAGEAAVVAGGVAAGAGGGVAIVAAVETASCAAFAAGLAIPFLP